MLTKVFGRSRIEEFCAEIGQIELCEETLDKEFKGGQENQGIQVCG